MPKKIEITEEFKTQVKELFDQDFGVRKIAAKLGTSRHLVKEAYKELGIDASGRKPARKAHLATEKTCIKCNLLKPISEFRQRYNKETDRISYECYCLICDREYRLERGKRLYEEHPEKWVEYRETHKEEVAARDKAYREENKDILREKSKARSKKRIENDPSVRLRQYVSNTINDALFKNGSSKNGESCIKYLLYTIKELKFHIEEQFKLPGNEWMNWKNRGRYNSKTWDDNDPSTWVWNLDHIIPQSDLPYSSMEEDNFKKCWALENLRPLSAKQNLLDGVNRSRHENKSPNKIIL